METKVFHYTGTNLWPSIKADGLKSENSSGKSRNIGTVYPPAMAAKGIWAFIEPNGQSWRNSSVFQEGHVMGNLLFHTGFLLLEIDVPEFAQNVFVADWGYIEPLIRGRDIYEESRLPERYKSASLLEAEKKYFDTMVPLHAYMRDSKAYEFELAEVIFKDQSIPRHLIRVSRQQPNSIEEVRQIVKQEFRTFY